MWRHTAATCGCQHVAVTVLCVGLSDGAAYGGTLRQHVAVNMCQQHVAVTVLCAGLSDGAACGSTLRQRAIRGNTAAAPRQHRRTRPGPSVSPLLCSRELFQQGTKLCRKLQ